MARIRSIKPEIRTSEKVNSWPIELRYFWVLLWGYCDDYGRGKDNARLINADAFPLDDAVDVATVDSWMDVLAQADVIRRYEVGGTSYFHVKNWGEHQKVQHPSKQTIPCPHGFVNGSCNAHETLVSGSGDTHPRGGGEQGAWSMEGDTSHDAEPPPFCPNHMPNGSGGIACGPCADARKGREIWAKNRPIASTPQPRRGTPTSETCNHKFVAGWCVMGCEQAEPAAVA